MAPTEESILSNFLLSPAPLPTVLSLQKFTELFPKRLRGHPHIRTLYRELQQVREHDLDRINENIDEETQRGERQKAELRKASRASGVEAANADEQRELDVDLHLFGQNSTEQELYHSPASLLEEMEAACANIEREIGEVDREAEGLLKELQTAVGDLSDLRYGKLQGPAGTESNLGEEVVRGLENLENACYGAKMGGSLRTIVWGRREPRRVVFTQTSPILPALQTQPHSQHFQHRRQDMPSIQIHPQSSKHAGTATSNGPALPASNPLPQLLQTPSGLAILELQGTINLPISEDEDNQYTSQESNSNANGADFETPIGKLIFPDYSPLNPDDTKWMKRVYLYVGRYQRMTGEVKKLPRPIAMLQKRAPSATNEELEVVEIIRYKIFFKNRPEPVNDV